MTCTHSRTRTTSKPITMATLTLLCLLAATCSRDPELGTMKSEFSPGIEIGEKVPVFSLSDQHGTKRDFGSLVGPKGLIIVFHRSADW